MKTSTTFKATAGVLAALTVAGVAAWIYQLVNGLGVTGMSNSTSWGLYITCFMLDVYKRQAYCLFAERSYAMSCALCLLGLRDFFRI